jgi:DNA-binding CsgD family transcriptional regulator
MLVERQPAHNPSILGFARPYSPDVQARERERSRCRDRLESLAGARLDPDEGRREAIAALRRAVGFERWCWPLADPASALSVSGIGDVDFWPSLARLVALEHGGDIVSKPQLCSSARASVALSAATSGDLACSPRWRECLQPYGIGDELMTACRDRHGFWGSVELMRDRSDAPFDDDDQRLLDELAPILGALLRRSQARAWGAASGAAESLSPGTLVLDSELQPGSWTESVRGWLRELPAAGPNGDMLPPAVYEIGARALTPTHLPNRVRIRGRAGRWLVIEGAPLEGASGSSVAITVRAAGPEEILDVLCRAYGLTQRERNLVALLLDGLSTRQLAHAMYISPYTVQDHLKAIFAKAGVRSRRELISQMAGRVPAGDRAPT